MRLVLATVLLLSTFAPAHATVFLTGTVGAGTNATLDTATDPKSLTSTLNAPGTISAGVGSLVTSNPYWVKTDSNVNAIWTSADSGTFLLTWSWQVGTGGSGLLTVAETNLAIPNWAYTFTATGDGTFDGRYSVVGAGQTFGLQQLFGWGDMVAGFGGDVYDPTASGSFSYALVNGQTYSFGVYNYGNLGNISGFDSTANAAARIDWTINYAAVPEPASWAMMITGFALAGAAARRRRAIAA